MVTNISCDCYWHVCLFFCLCAVASGAEDVALYVGIVAVALCLTLLLIVPGAGLPQEEGRSRCRCGRLLHPHHWLPAHGHQAHQPGVWATHRAARSSRLLFLCTIHPSSRCFTPILSSQCPCSCATCGYSNSQSRVWCGVYVKWR